MTVSNIENNSVPVKVTKACRILDQHGRAGSRAALAGGSAVAQWSHTSKSYDINAILKERIWLAGNLER